MNSLTQTLFNAGWSLITPPAYTEYIRSFMEEIVALPEDGEVSIKTALGARWMPKQGNMDLVYPQITPPDTSLFERAVKGLMATQRKNPDSAFSKNFISGRCVAEQGGPVLLLAGSDPTCAKAIQYLFPYTELRHVTEPVEAYILTEKPKEEKKKRKRTRKNKEA